MALINLPDVIGLPPLGSTISELDTRNSIPVMQITPSKPSIQDGLTLFRLSPNLGRYKSLLNQHGYNIKDGPLKVGFIADTFPADTFSNQYSESFLNRFTDVISTGTAEISQIFGGRSAGEVIDAVIGAMERSEWDIVSGIGGMIRGGGELIAKGFTGMGEAVDKALGTHITKTMSTVISRGSKLLAGSRVDFPMIWKNSSYAPSYTFTVRLYNPVPGNLDAKKKYIVGPLAALLLLGLPVSDDGIMFNWPFFHKIECPGLFVLKAAYIGNISVVKGGDQHQISFGQDVGSIDVRIEVGSLYDSMLVSSYYEADADRPTLEQYLKNLEGRRDIIKTSEEIYNQRMEIENNQISRAIIETELTPNERVDSVDIVKSLDILLSERSDTTYQGLVGTVNRANYVSQVKKLASRYKTQIPYSLYKEANALPSRAGTSQIRSVFDRIKPYVAV